MQEERLGLELLGDSSVGLGARISSLLQLLREQLAGPPGGWLAAESQLSEFTGLEFMANR